MDLKSAEERSKELVRILKELPPHHRETMNLVVFHLARVAEKQEENKMNPQNLAIIMAPCIIRAPDHISPLEVAQQIGQTTRAVELIIKYQLESIKSKFRSLSEYDHIEKKIIRSVTNAKRTKRSTRATHRRSRLVPNDDEVYDLDKVSYVFYEKNFNTISKLLHCN